MKRSSFIEGTFIATFAIFIIKILGMLYVIPFYAIVGIEGSALYAYAYNIYNIFLDISTVGLPIAMSKITNEYNSLNKMDAKQRAYSLAITLMRFVSVIVFLLLFLFARNIAQIIIGDLVGGNTIEDVTVAIKFISLSLLVIPYLSVTKGYLQGHNVINIPSIGNVIEQVVRIAIVLLGSFITIKIFHKSYALGVDIALLGAFFGGLASYSYIKLKMRRNKAEFSLDGNVKKDNITNKEIAKKLARYAIPFIIINSIASLYSFIDMVLVLKTMEYIGYDAVTVEMIATSISTWAGKINMIITSIAMGMTVSLIPSIVESFTLKKWEDVNSKINTSLKMILFISIPMAIGLSMLSPEVWSVFYGNNEIGATILSLSVFVGVAFNLFMITSSIMQSLNKFKVVYIATILGFLINGILDVPIMLFFNYIGIPSYLGASVASIIGYLVASLIALKEVGKNSKIKYNDTFNIIKKMTIPTLLMIIVLIIFKVLIKVDLTSKLYCILFIALNSLVGAFIYLFTSYKIGLINDVFTSEILNKLKRKLNLKKD